MRLGLVRRTECWTLSFRGWILVLAAAIGFAVLIRFEAYSFLAPNQPVDTDTLIVEGWIPNYTLNQAAYEFKKGKYNRLLIVRSMYEEEFGNKYEIAAGRSENMSRLLASYGVPPESIRTLFYPAIQRDRTYHAALAVKELLAADRIPVKSLNVVTLGPHARRSWLLFQKVFASSAQIGIVPLNDPTFDPKHWWRTSEGVREVLGESIAYIYARFFFRGG